jgi:hypothetical protein
MLNTALALLESIAPRDELEAALAMQMTGCHLLAMQMLARTRHCDRTDQMQLYGGLAVKLQRTFAAQVEALAKLRGGGKQQIEVRYIHVNGNAILGDVHTGGGGGVLTKNGDRPQAQALAHLPSAPVPEVWRTDTGGDELPIAGRCGPETLPDARRNLSRGA